MPKRVSRDATIAKVKPTTQTSTLFKKPQFGNFKKLKNSLAVFAIGILTKCAFLSVIGFSILPKN